MSELQKISETPITLVKLKDELERIEKRDKTLSARSVRVKEYLDIFVQMDTKKTEELINKLKELSLLRLKDRHIVKIVDLLPKDVEKLKMILAGESSTLKTEDLQKVVDVINA